MTKEPRFVARRSSEEPHRRIFGNQARHPLSGWTGGRVDSGQWPNWVKAFEEQQDGRIKVAMLQWGILLPRDDQWEEYAFDALCFYLALADQHGEQHGMSRMAEAALSALMNTVFNEHSKFYPACSETERFVDVLLSFFCEWPYWQSMNGNIPLLHMPRTTSESHALYGALKEWACRLWREQERTKLLADEDRRHHLLVLLVRLRCFGIGSKDLKLGHLVPGDAVWLRYMHETLMPGAPIECSLRGGLWENTYLADLVALTEAKLAAMKS